MSTLLEQASLVMIPSGYKEDIVYSQIPTNGNGDLSFTRASNGTRVNSAGLVEVCPWNLFQQSEDFSNAAWTKTNTTVTSNSTTAPNGTLTADLIVPANATDGVIVQSSLSFIVGTSYSLSVYGKKEDFNFLLLALPSAAFPTSNRVALFDLNSGTIASSTQSGTGAVITDVGNGWYRCSITITATATTSANVVVAARSSNNLTSLGNGTDGIYIWGAQLNTGELKPYFPTTDRLNVPRLTYQNGGGGCPSLLLEKQSTNLLTYSEDFTNAAYSKQEITVTANASTAPDGTNTATRVTPTTVTGTHQISRTLVSIAQHTISVFVKANGYNTIEILDFGTGSNGATFDVSAGTVTNKGTGTGTITNFGNGWYRCTATCLTTGIRFYIPTSSGTFTGNGTSGLFIWGAQMEASSYPTSYIPTTSASATRVADACSKTGISSLIGQTEGVLFADVNLTTRQSFTYISISNGGSSANYIGIYFRAAAIEMEVVNGGVLQGNVQYSNTSTGRFKIAIGYKQNDFVLYVNGTQIGTDTSGTVPTCDRLDLFAFNDNQPLQVNEAVLFPTRLTNAELASITSL